MRDARRASSRNIDTNSGTRARWGKRHFNAIVRENPTGPKRRPRWTVAIAPAAIWSNTAYRSTTRGLEAPAAESTAEILRLLTMPRLLGHPPQSRGHRTYGVLEEGTEPFLAIRG